VPNVTLTLTGTLSGSTLSDDSGNYALSSLASGGSYTVTPAKSALAPGSPGINTVDVVAVQRHFLNFAPIPPGCRLTAADVTGNGIVNTIDSIGIQRFFIGLTTGIANAGRYQFTPVSRKYPGIASDQTAQNYDTLVFGDVVSPFADRAGGSSQDATEKSLSVSAPIAVAALSLPNVTADMSVTSFIGQVTTTTINADDDLVAFQGDFIFDSSVVTFQSPPVVKAGLTAGHWNVSGNVLPGTGNLMTLRISAFSNNFAPLTGSGTLFELRMTRVSSTPGASTQLVWAAPPNHFIFIDENLQERAPLSAPPGSVPIEAAQTKPAPPLKEPVPASRP
jgi:hypothetical protein